MNYNRIRRARRRWYIFWWKIKINLLLYLGNMELAEKDLLEGNKILYEIQKNLNAPKTEYNSFGKYTYRTAEGILQAVKEIIPEGYSITCRDSIEYVGDRYYVKSTVTLTNGKHTFTSSAYAREPENKTGMDSCQITGAASSYAKKYALNNLFAIDDARDLDSQTPTDKSKEGEIIQTPKEVDGLPPITMEAISKLKLSIEKWFDKGFDNYITAAEKKFSINEKQKNKIKEIFTSYKEKKNGEGAK